MNDSEGIWWGFFFTVIITMALTVVMADYTAGGPGGVQFHDKARFDAVCTYAGGQTNGDLCIKNNTVILRKDDVK